jgi:hypothetical protein
MAGLVLNVVRLAPEQPHLGETQPEGADENMPPTKRMASMPVTNRKRPAAAAAIKTPGGTQRGSSGRRRARTTKKVRAARARCEWGRMCGTGRGTLVSDTAAPPRARAAVSCRPWPTRT